MDDLKMYEKPKCDLCLLTPAGGGAVNVGAEIKFISQHRQLIM